MSTSDSSREHLQLLLAVARMAYEDDLTQQEIAGRIGYSRPTVSRLLAEARERGIVRVTISHPLEQALECETQLQRRFGLRHAAVAISDTTRTAEAVGRLAGQTIAGWGGPRAMLALSNGSSLAAVVDAMPQQRWPSSCVTQMIGSLGRVDQQMADSPELCRRMAERLGGIHRPLPVPLVLSSAAVAASVRHEEVVLTTLELAARSDIAVCGVGAVRQDGGSGAILAPFMTAEIEDEVIRGGAVAHICGHHFDAAGRHVRTSLCERLITMAPERLGDIPWSVVVAWGPEKVPALHAVLRTGFLSSIVTDERTARAVLSYQP
ncbi:MAG: MarR family transcriptional regulator [Propionibacteriaceae bacterium]|nr:MarR family transcriptional regulator [Propionibacteriaceae bacterium]